MWETSCAYVCELESSWSAQPVVTVLPSCWILSEIHMASRTREEAAALLLRLPLRTMDATVSVRDLSTPTSAHLGLRVYIKPRNMHDCLVKENLRCGRIFQLLVHAKKQQHPSLQHGRLTNMSRVEACEPPKVQFLGSDFRKYGGPSACLGTRRWVVNVHVGLASCAVIWAVSSRLGHGVGS